MKMRKYKKWNICILWKDKKVFYDDLELLNKILQIINKERDTNNL